MKALLAVFLLSVHSFAAAQAYLGAGAGIQRVYAQGLEERHTLMMATAGYRFGPVAAEAFYGSSSTYGAAGLVHVPLAEGFSIVGRLAAYHLKGSITESTVTPGAAGGPVGTLVTPGSTVAIARSVAWDGWTPAIGVGVQYSARGGLGARLLLEQSRGVDQLERARILSVLGLYSF